MITWFRCNPQQQPPTTTTNALVDSKTHLFREIQEEDLTSDCHLVEISNYDNTTINLYDKGADLFSLAKWITFDNNLQR